MSDLLADEERQREGLYHKGQARGILVVIFRAFILTASQKGQTPMSLAGSFPLAGAGVRHLCWHRATGPVPPLQIPGSPC